MSTPTTPTKTTTNFDEAIRTYSDAAYDLFYNAQAELDAPPPTAEAAETAQSELMGAFTQLSGAAHMQSEQRNRDGFDAVVELMKTTADAAGKISTKLVGLLHADAPGAPAASDYQLIDELKDTLDVLARLSPSAVWTAPSGSTRSG